MMYHLKKIITYDEPIKTPNCMYSLRKIYSFHEQPQYFEPENIEIDICNQVKKFHKQSDNKMAELEYKQDLLLKKLDVLYEKIKSISVLTQDNYTKEKVSAVIPAPEEIVLVLSPDNLPWFLQVFNKHSSVSINIQWHIHSTVSKENMKTLEFFLKSFSSQYDSNINIRLILKHDLADPELKLSSLDIPIIGYVNILRYLSLAYPSVIPYNSQDFNVDSLLDICHLLSKSLDKNREVLIKQLFSQYNGWIYKDFSIVDLAAYNVLKQANNKSKQIPNDWFHKCEQMCVL